MQNFFLSLDGGQSNSYAINETFWDLVVRLSIRLCLLSWISLRLIALLIYLLKGLCSPSLEIRGQIVCQELTRPWHWWIG